MASSLGFLAPTWPSAVQAPAGHVVSAYKAPQAVAEEKVQERGAPATASMVLGIAGVTAMSAAMNRRRRRTALRARGGEAQQAGQVVTVDSDVSSKVQDIVWQLAQGNKRYMRTYVGAGGSVAPKEPQSPAVDALIDDPLNPATAVATVISCARSYAPMDTVFDTQPGELVSIRLCANACSAHDGVVGSVEMALEAKGAPLLLVLGNTSNDIIEAAVRSAMGQVGRGSDAPAAPVLSSGRAEEDMSLVKRIVPCALDAIKQSPGASFKDLCNLTGQLNVWNTISELLSSSAYIQNLCKANKLSLQGAFFDVETGRVQFLGEHPAKASLLLLTPPEERARTAQDPDVPAEEAHAALYVGNRRYATDNGGDLITKESSFMRALAVTGQNPVGIVLGCADSRAPIEILYDMRPGDTFVLRTAGNSVGTKQGSLIGSAEYAIAVLKTKFFVVLGHNKCGAITAAHGAANTEEKTEAFAGTGIKDVLDEIIGSVFETMEKIPDADAAEQINESAKKNVFNTMQKLMEISDIVKDGVKKQDLVLVGAFYNIITGELEWMGEHPDREKIIGSKLPMSMWMEKPYIRQNVAARGKLAQQAIKRLTDGNQRFMAGESQYRVAARRGSNINSPYAIIVGGADTRVSYETIFDAEPGDLIAQRVMGNVAGLVGGCLFTSLEYAVEMYEPSVLLVVGDSKCSTVADALDRVKGAELASAAKRTVLERIQPAAMRALAYTQPGNDNSAATDAGLAIQQLQMAVELNALYTIEQLLSRSAVIRKAVQENGLELHAAILNRQTGLVEMVGQHPMTEALLEKPMAE